MDKTDLLLLFLFIFFFSLMKKPTTSLPWTDGVYFFVSLSVASVKHLDMYWLYGQG